MLSIDGHGTRLCDGLTRREWLRVGGLSALGVGLPDLLKQRLTAASVAGNAPAGTRAKSCIVLFMLGGPPQHETWDPKPEAPVEIRGDLQPISSVVAGFAVGELMPETARLTDKICALRAVSTKDNAHSTSGYAMCTGVSHRPLGVEGAKPGAPNDWPCMGAVVRRLRRSRGGLPSAITVPEIAANDGNKTWPGQDAGWLGRSADPWLLTCDPSSDDFQIPGLALPQDVPSQRFEERTSLLKQLDRQFARIEDSQVLDGHDTWYQQAFGLLGSSAARSAFDLKQEPDAVRDRYGRTRFGQSVLLARRLVESGVSLVQVNWTRLPNALNNGHWDTHSQNTAALRKHLMPVMDQTYSALLEDLAQRGLLDDTLVVWMGEFGRTPKINGNGGRDHWGSVFSIALAGGGVRGGQVYGASDRLGAAPKEGRLGAADVAATIFHALGYRPETPMYDILDRPIAISQGRPVTQIF
jgi:hypothetical protein